MSYAVPVIERLIGRIPFDAFMETRFGRVPHASPGAGKAWLSLGGWGTFARAARSREADLLVARDGRLREGPFPRGARGAERLLADGWTLVLRHAERHGKNLRTWADGVGRDFGAPVDIHLYTTPEGKSGFGWHYDAVDLFLLQTEGRKEYAIRKNTVNPWPTLETIPRDMRFERETSPVRMTCVLSPGDCLYIPAGYWHAAQGVAGRSTTVAIGVMSATALDLLDALRRRLAHSLLWRQRLVPVPGTAGAAALAAPAAPYGALFEELGRDLAEALADPAFLQAFLAERAARVRPKGQSRSKGQDGQAGPRAVQTARPNRMS